MFHCVFAQHGHNFTHDLQKVVEKHHVITAEDFTEKEKKIENPTELDEIN